MATVNKRSGLAQAMTANGIALGGLMECNINQGYDQPLESPQDGAGVGYSDSVTQFTRGTIAVQDWVHLLDILTGTVGTLVFHERLSGVARTTGFQKYTVTNPVFYKAGIQINHRGYAVLTAEFECKAADVDKGFADMLVPLAGQVEPDYVSAARGYEITAADHDSVDIAHVSSLSLALELPLYKSSMDGDVGYTAVDAEQSGIKVAGAISFQDRSLSTTKLLGQALLGAAAGALAATIKQSQAAASKIITIAGCKFQTIGMPSGNSDPYTSQTLNYIIQNSTGTPLTLDGVNKIVTIA